MKVHSQTNSNNDDENNNNSSKSGRSTDRGALSSRSR